MDMKHANDMLEISRLANMKKLDKTLSKVMRIIVKEAKKGRTDTLLHKKSLGDNNYLREIVASKLREQGYSVDTWRYSPFVEIKWR